MNERRSRLPAVACVCIAAALISVPTSIADALRGYVRDALRPGQIAAATTLDASRRLVDSVHIGESTRDSSHEIDDAARLRIRRLQVANARLREQLARRERLGKSPFIPTESKPLLVADLVTARVLGRETAALWKSGKLLGRGTSHGLAETDLVLADDGAPIDQGADTGLAEGQPVYSGRCVIGRLRRVGRYSSTVEPLTAETFRGPAQLVQHGEDGDFRFGAIGVLKGDAGKTCHLEMIPASAPVSVSDLIYTPTGDGSLPFPMYYGRVVQAKLKPAALHWEIEVEPAMGEVDARTVHVLRRRVNPARR